MEEIVLYMASYFCCGNQLTGASECSGITKLNGRILVTSSCVALDVLAYQMEKKKPNKYKECFLTVT